MLRKHTKPPNSMPTVRRDPFNGEARQTAGFIVTLREQQTDRRVVLHRSGPGAMAQICGEIDAMEGDWKLLSLSTPTTIWRDLQGTRKNEWRDIVDHPEIATLGHQGRLDLLDPFFDPEIPRGRTHF